MSSLAKSAAIAAVLFISTLGSAQSEDTKKMTVYKTAWCGCCKVWADAMVKAGYSVETKNLEDLQMTKRQAGVPSTP